MFELHPLYETFRDVMGRPLRLTQTRTAEFTPAPHVVGVATFVSAIGQACLLAPEWAEVLVFSSEPIVRRDLPEPATAGIGTRPPDDNPDFSPESVSYFIVTTKQEPPGCPAELPGWLLAFQVDKRCLTKKL